MILHDEAIEKVDILHCLFETICKESNEHSYSSANDMLNKCVKEKYVLKCPEI